MRNRLRTSALATAIGAAVLTLMGCETDQGMTCGTGQLSALEASNQPPKHQYYYYPSTQVYRDCEADRWFWPTEDGWENGKKLPSMIELGEEIPFAIELIGNDPTAQHASTAVEYPAAISRPSVNASAPVN